MCLNNSPLIGSIAAIDLGTIPFYNIFTRAAIQIERKYCHILYHLNNRTNHFGTIGRRQMHVLIMSTQLIQSFYLLL